MANQGYDVVVDVDAEVRNALASQDNTTFIISLFGEKGITVFF